MALFGCLWLHEFPAWSAAQADRLLGYGPFFIHHRGVVVAVSDLAREAGIVTGWTVHRAQSLVPNAEALPLDAGATAFAWREVLAGLYGHTPRIEPVRQGLAYFEVPTRKEGLTAFAAWVRDQGIRCGIADSRVLAELAAYSALPGEVKHVPSRGAARFLDALSAETLTAGGVSESTVERLQWFGWSTVGSLDECDRRHLVEQFDDGAIVARFAGAGKFQTLETAPVTAYVPPPTITARIAFDEPATEPGEWEPSLPEILERLCTQLNGREGAELTLVALTCSGRKVRTHLLREPMREARRLLEPALTLSREMLTNASNVHGFEVQLGALGVHLHQVELFDSTRQRHERLIDSVRFVRSRGLGEIVRVQILNPFTPFPEDAYALVPWPDVLPAVVKAPQRRVRA